MLWKYGKNFPSYIWEVQFFKNSWPLKDSYVKLKKKKKRNRKETLHSVSPSESHTWWNSQQKLSIKLTYFHLVQRNSIVTSNTKWTRFATPRSQKEKAGLEHVIGQNKNATGDGITILVFYFFLDSNHLYCIKMLQCQHLSRCVLRAYDGFRSSSLPYTPQTFGYISGSLHGLHRVLARHCGITRMLSHTSQRRV